MLRLSTMQNGSLLSYTDFKDWLWGSFTKTETIQPMIELEQYFWSPINVFHAVYPYLFSFYGYLRWLRLTYHLFGWNGPFLGRRDGMVRRDSKMRRDSEIRRDPTACWDKAARHACFNWGHWKVPETVLNKEQYAMEKCPADKICLRSISTPP